MRPRFVAFLAALSLVPVGPAVAQGGPAGAGHSPHPVVLELFTSQGCSSCPPADRLLADLSRDSSLIAITRPVTYWDRWGWKDTLARKENTDLQWAYAHRFSPGTGIYAPQVVVNGAKAAAGANRQDILALVASAQVDSPTAVVAVKVGENGGLTVSVTGKTGADAELVLVALDSSASVAVAGGENSGGTLAYANVVVDERKLGDWRGGAKDFSIAPDLLPVAGADRYAVLLRVLDGGPVLAGAMLPAR